MTAVDFSKNGYKALLDSAQSSGYQFITFSELEPLHNSGMCLLRHDVDVSVDLALEMAAIEAELGVRATYFLMLRSPVYNLYSRASFRALRKILGLGHEIALHFDAAHPQFQQVDLEEAVTIEADALSQLIGETVSAVSFHQPTKEVLENDLLIEGFVNTYSKTQLADWFYISDSNRQWRQEDAKTLFERARHKKVQLLIHPMWWMCDDNSTEAVWNRAIRRNFEEMEKQLLETERAYGPSRTFEIS